MKIDSIEISVFELPMYRSTIRAAAANIDGRPPALGALASNGLVPVQVIRVRTDDGVDGVCTVGDWRYTEMTAQQLAMLRQVAIGEDPLNRDRLNSKLRSVARFFDPAWFGGFDNCLWDIAGKVSGMPVAQLLGGAKDRVQSYYNIAGRSLDELVKDGESALEQGYTVLKDHLPFDARENIRLFRELRKSFGDEVGLMHDAAVTRYTYEEALKVGHALEEEEFIWLEEPLPDRQLENYVRLTDALDIPVAGAETLMHDPDLSALWLRSGAVDILRVHGRHGTTPLLKLAHFAEMHHANVEPNAYGSLFGIVHAHLDCGIGNIRWFEPAPPSGGAEMGEEIGLLNPIVPQDGWVTFPNAPGWGAEWDWKQFEKARVATL
jgi:L-alanine-DL-glutamate epimerase-like enolase superfamily enzyme